MSLTKKIISLLIMLVFLIPISLFAKEKVEEKTEKDRWKSSLGISYVTISGNSQSQTLSILAEALRKGDNNEGELKAGSIYGESEGKKTADYWYANGKYTHNLSEKTYLFCLLGIEGNKLANLNCRFSANSGVGYRFLEGTHELKGELGPGYVYEDRIGDKNLSYLSGRAYAKYIFHITKSADFSQDAEYLHDFENSKGYRVNTETALTMKILEWISIKAGVTVKYANQPPANTKNKDIFTSTSLIFTF